MTGSSLQHPSSEPQFTVLPDALLGLVFAVEAVDDLPTTTVDIKTDDVDAEVARLVALGATGTSTWAGCHTLLTPGGHLVCVIPVHSEAADLTAPAQTWP